MACRVHDEHHPECVNCRIDQLEYHLREHEHTLVSLIHELTQMRNATDRTISEIEKQKELINQPEQNCIKRFFCKLLHRNN